MRENEKGRARWRGAILPLLLLALWWASAQFNWVSSSVLVTPVRLLAVLGDPALRGALFDGMEASAIRLF